MQKKRYVILDALRGFAILGIILANFPEFSLWTFSDPSGWTDTDKKQAGRPNPWKTIGRG